MSTTANKPTPGPWTVADYKTYGTEAHVIRSPENGVDDPHPVVASVVKRPGYTANARLIAAAPDLLEQLRAVEWAGTTNAEEGGYVACCPSCGAEEDDGHDENCTLAAAIAKAEGRTP